MPRVRPRNARLRSRITRVYGAVMRGRAGAFFVVGILVALSACSGGSDDTATTGGEVETSGVSESLAGGGSSSSGDNATPAGTDADSSVTGSSADDADDADDAPVFTDPTLPTTTSTPDSGLADETIAQVVVDGLGYNLCATVAGSPALESALGAPVTQEQPQTLQELTRAYGHTASSEVSEGAVACRFVATTDGSGVATELIVWTDESLQFSLEDPSATAAARAADIRARVWSGDDPFGYGVATDLIGVGDGGWSGHTTTEYDAYAWQGPVLIELATTVDSSGPFCDGDQATVQACHAERMAPTVAALTDLFPTLYAAFSAGDGRPAAFPDVQVAPAVAMVDTPDGPKDLCALGSAALPLFDPNHEYDPATGTDAWTSYFADASVEGGTRCLFEGRDRDTTRSISVVVWGDDIDQAEPMFRDDVATYSPDPVPGIADEAYAAYTSVYILKAGMYLNTYVYELEPSDGTDILAQATAWSAAVMSGL
jgi:hypothetical protein